MEQESPVSEAPAANLQQETAPTVPEANIMFPNKIEASPEAKKWGFRIAIIVAALLFLQIPIVLISSLASDRESQQTSAACSIATHWGAEQIIHNISLDEKVPETLTADTKFIPEIRYRGIYQTVIYTADSRISAKFAAPGKSISMEISDLNGLVDISVKINGNPAACSFQRNEKNGLQTIVIPLPANTQGEVNCDIDLKLRGSTSFAISASAKKSQITFSGDWDSPNFGDNTMPDSREVANGKFKASWQLNNFFAEVQQKTAQVTFHIAASTYQQVERTINYATLFLIVFFFTLIIAEKLSGTVVLTLQYLIASGAPVLFYLMLLSVSEKTGFAIGYLISAAVIVTMISGYIRLVFGKALPALIIGGIFAASYAANYWILQMEDFALLGGTIILAIILAVLMFLTGKLNRPQA